MVEETRLQALARTPKSKIIPSHRLRRTAFKTSFALAAYVAATLTRTTSAATVSWTGTTDSTWAGANWTGGSGTSPPSSDLTSDLAGFGLSSYPHSPVVGANVSVSGLQITGSAPLTIGGSSNLTLGANGIDMQSNAGAATISAPLILGMPQTWQNASTSAALTISSSKITNNSNLLTLGGAGSITISSVIGSGSGGLLKTGAGVLTLSGSSTYTGTTTIAQGTLVASNIVVASNASNLGNATSPVVLGDATNQGILSYSGNSATYTRGLTINAGGGEVDVSTAGQTLTFGSSNISVTSTLTIGGAGNSSFLSGALIKGAGGLIKTGTGTLTLTGSYSYAGTTTISQGTLVATNNIAGGANSNLGNSTSPVILGDATHKGILSFAGNATTLYARGFTINAGGGEFDVTNVSAIVTINNNGISANGDFTVGGASTTIVASAISGMGRVIKAGSGSLNLTAANSFQGGVSLSAGTLNILDPGALGTGTFSIGSIGGSSVAFDNNSASGSITTSTHNNLQNWNQDFTYLGSVPGNDLNLGTGAVTLAATRQVTVSANNLTVGGVISGASTFGLTKAGAGMLTLGGANTFDGATSVSAGTLNLNNSLALQNSTVATGGTGIVFNAAVSSHAFAFGGLSGSTNLALTDSGNNAVALSIGNNNTATTFSGNLTGTGGSLIKIGSGTLTLTGGNTYTGPTLVNLGKLIVNGSLASGAVVTVANTAMLGGTGTVGATEIQSGGILNPAGSGVTGSFNLGALTLDSGAIVQLDLKTTAAGGYDEVIATGYSGSGATLEIDLAPGAGQFHVNDAFQVFNSNGIGGKFTNFILPANYRWDTSKLGVDGRLYITAIVPEPGPLLLGLIALIPGGLALRKSRKSRH